MKRTVWILLYAVVGWVALTTRAADIAGQWRAEFDSQIGQQKYLFNFQMNEGKLSAKATAEARGEKREVEFQEPKLEGDTFTFVEMRKFQDNEMRIEYTGKVTDKEIKFTVDGAGGNTIQWDAKKTS